MKSLLLATYSIIAYLIGMVASIYIIGFVMDTIVPKTIDTGESGDMISSLLINSGLLGIFMLQHSGMARRRPKSIIVRYIHPSIERSTYVLLSGLVIALLCWFWRPVTDEVWRIDQKIGIYLMYSISIIGWLIAMLSTYMINHAELFGLQQVYDFVKKRSARNSNFQIKYLYKFVRHPLMLGFIIAFWATPVMTIGHLLFAISMTAYIFLSVKYLEEPDLREALGQSYEDYQKEVPMIFPIPK